MGSSTGSRNDADRFSLQSLEPMTAFLSTKSREEEETNLYREPGPGRGVIFIHLFIL